MPDTLSLSAAEVVVIGGGTMGAGIAQVLLGACPDGRVHLVERDEASLAAAVDRVRRGMGDDAPSDALDRLCPHVGVEAEGEVALVIEAVPENAPAKHVVLDAAVKAWPDALLATNTSSLSVTELGADLPEDCRFIGMHFFNPVPRSKLVEIVVPDGCAEGTVDDARRWVDHLDKQHIVVRDSPGFATSRLGVAIALEAMRMVEDGVATAEDIDRGMVLGYSFPIGPLRLTDMIGLDVRLAIAEHLAETLGARFEPPGILRSLVAAGKLGRKTGQGFYEWEARR